MKLETKKLRELKKFNLCNTCIDKPICGSVSDELISPDDIENLRNIDIEAIAIVYDCSSWKEIEVKKK